MEGNKGKPATVDEYIARYPPEIQDILAGIRAVVKETTPEAEEKISYGMPGYYLNGGLVWFGVYKRHIGMYPWTSGMQASIAGLTLYKGTKGSVHFPLDKPMPYDLIRQIVQARIADNQKK